MTLFGSYAFAGLFVNLAAIPLVGLFVPAALVSAMIGMIPVAGDWLAWPAARFADLTGWLFLECGYWGARVAPPVSMPRPETGVVILYYVCLALFSISRKETVLGTRKETPGQDTKGNARP